MKHVLQVVWLIISTTVVGYVPKSPFKRWLNFHMSILCFEVLSSVLSLVVKYHNKENRPKSGICVANHTSPIDTLVLMCDNCYSLVSQCSYRTLTQNNITQGHRHSTNSVPLLMHYISANVVFYNQA